MLIIFLAACFMATVKFMPKQILQTDLSAYIHMEPMSHQHKKQFFAPSLQTINLSCFLAFSHTQLSDQYNPLNTYSVCLYMT